MVLSAKVSVTSPPQESVAEACANTGSTPHWMVEAAGSAAITGAVWSLTVMFCIADDVFPHASVKVQVRTMLNELAQLPGVMLSTLWATTEPEQLSVAVRDTGEGTWEAHETVRAAGAAGATGAVTSCKVKVAEVVAVLPQASVAVKVTVTAAVQSEPIELKLLVQVTAEHESFATAPPLLASHALRLAWFPEPVHSTVRFEAGVVMTGAVLSVTITVWVACDEFPHASVEVQVLTIV